MLHGCKSYDNAAKYKNDSYQIISQYLVKAYKCIFFRSVSSYTPKTHSLSVYDIQESLQEPVPVENNNDNKKKQKEYQKGTPSLSGKCPPRESQIYPPLPDNYK